MLFADRYEAGRFLALHKVIVPGATHLFEEPGMLEKAADLAKNGFITHVAKPSERNEAAELDQPRDRGANPENRLELFMADAPRMTVEELKRRMDAGENFTIVDVRNPQAWEQSATKIPGAIRVPMDHWEEKLPQIPKDRPVVTYCT